LSELTKETQDALERLIALHGEEGLCPTRRDWTAILQCAADKPLNILNLLKFKQSVETPEGSVSGFEAYGNYSAAVGRAFVRAGGTMLYFGKVNHVFGTETGTDWHAAILSRYPSPRALANFWLDPDFVTAHAHRASGVEASRVLVMNALREG
jgi:uncharacterized protein (DUF1330 family)